MTNPQSELKDLTAHEVSIVDKGANKKKRFPIFKQESPMNEEIIKAVLETQADDEDCLDEFCKNSELDETASHVIKGMYRLAASFKDKLPSDALKKLAEVSGYEEPVAKADKKEEIPEELMEEEDKEKKEKEKMDMKKSLEGVPEEVQKRVEDIFKAQESAMKELQKKNEEFEKALKAEKDRRELESWVSKAKEELAALPDKTPQELGEMFKKMADSDVELANNQFAIMKSAADAIKESALFKELGGRGEDNTGTAMNKVKKAAELIMKSESGLTKEQAFQKALEQNPSLYNEYMNEHPQQQGRN